METVLPRDCIEVTLAASLQLLDAYESDREVDGTNCSALRCSARVYPLHVAAGREASPTGSPLTKSSRRLEEAGIEGQHPYRPCRLRQSPKYRGATPEPITFLGYSR